MNTNVALDHALAAVEHLVDVEPPWCDLLESATTLIGSDSAAFVMFDDAGALIAFEQHHMDPAADRAYVEHFHRQDIITPVAMNLPEGAWLDTAELLPMAARSRNGYYVDFMCRYQMPQMLTFVVEQGAQRRAALTFHRSAPGDHARRMLESRPVRTFTAALQAALARRATEALRWLESVESAFDAFGEAVCLVAGSGFVVHMSPKAEKLLGESSGLRVRCGRLWHPLFRVREALAAAFAQAATGAAPLRLAIPGERGASCSVDMVRADARTRLAGEPMVIVRLQRHRSAEKVSVPALCLAFDITVAEARVLAALVEGRSPVEFAQARGVSIATVRTQIVALRSKMGCRRQSDLIRIALAAL